MADSLERLLAAAGVVVAWIALCVAIYLSERRRRRETAGEAAALAPASTDGAPVLVAFASQTGTARTLAWQTARSLHLAGVPSRVLALSEVAAADLQQSQRVLFLVSTYGEGDAPDNAAGFVRRLMNARLPLRHLRYGLLAMGDRAYADFRGFGLALEQWLARQGAQPLFERVDVDRGDEAALHDWRHRLGRTVGTRDLPDWQGPAFERWRLVSRRHLNPGSAGNPIFHVELAWPDGPVLRWQAGDLLQVAPPDDPARPREYSIASLPADGSVHLLVRLERHGDGTSGKASGWLGEHAVPGSVVMARVRAHENFRLGGNAGRPLILIGNGTGLAGLLGLIRARAAVGSGRIWLLYGERNAARDFHHRELIDAWHRDGVIERVDRVFSRDQASRRYVQHQLLAAADDVRRWVQAGAAVYVCGSLIGMAAGVDEVLRECVGPDALDELLETGRYRRDVY